MTDLRTVEPVLVLVDRAGQEQHYLLELHETWRSFMFPVTLIRELRDEDWGIRISEELSDVACRAVAEATGLLVHRTRLTPLKEIKVTKLSHSHGKVTGYRFTVFHYRIASDETLQPRSPVHWLSLADIVDPGRGPISPVAQAVARAVLEQELG